MKILQSNDQEGYHTKRANFDDHYFPGTKTHLPAPPSARLVLLLGSLDIEGDPLPVLGGDVDALAETAPPLTPPPIDALLPPIHLSEMWWQVKPSESTSVLEDDNVSSPLDKSVVSDGERLVEGTLTAEVEHALFVASPSKAEPSSYRQALNHPDADEWQKAAQEEMELMVAMALGRSFYCLLVTKRSVLAGFSKLNEIQMTC
ncbi:hypothetical protein EW146_g5347 [Bondarzewia mesenterica]|uniref:Uncharacterized protein n=1 Tax=Bondarzewia mesenterica TaxID=1095465 RepID=A0A4S4LSE3_9AGAM|nr:hypothetical protein EW146_g5347 [Bondarzewia mesenterica]